MKITKKDYEKATVLSLKGKIRIGSGDVELREATDRAVADGAKNLAPLYYHDRVASGGCHR